MKEKIKLLVKIIVGQNLYRLFCILPIQNKVVFSSFSGKRYDDNPKAISKKLYELYPDIKQVWLHHTGYDKFDIEYANVVEWPSLKVIYELATARIWVDSHHKPCWVVKRKHQFFIETWHGGLGFKQIEADAESRTFTEQYCSKHSIKMIDLMISNSKWLTELYRKSFGYQGKIIECGYPKEEVFFNDTGRIEQKVKKDFKIDANTKILLYAPTFRDDKNYSVNDFPKINFHQLLNLLENKTQQKWCALIRLHPLDMKYENDFGPYDKKILNATHYSSMQDLTLATEMFISDYSSGIFDFADLRRPAFLYVPDIDIYVEKRGLYLKLEDTPFPNGKSQKELFNQIEKFDLKKYTLNVEKFYKRMGYINPQNASEKVCEIIYNYLFEQ